MKQQIVEHKAEESKAGDQGSTQGAQPEKGIRSWMLAGPWAFILGAWHWAFPCTSWHAQGYFEILQLELSWRRAQGSQGSPAWG